MTADELAELAERYYTELATAFVRGRLGGPLALSPEQSLLVGRRAGLRLHKFKRNASLPRVHKALGILRGLAPDSLVDVGSGRGAFSGPCSMVSLTCPSPPSTGTRAGRRTSARSERVG